MTDPARPSPAPNQTETETPEPLGTTLVRPEGSFAFPSLPRELPFGPAEEDGDLGKLGRYRVVKKLGEGGMGAVYLGADTALGRRVALKVMLPQFAADPESKERFMREARAAAAVHSDHVVTIHDVGEDRGIPFIAMEYLLGYPLDRFLRTQGNPSLANVIRIGRETALGLAAAHKLGLIHRDIKPGNVWLEAPKGRVKILDFGLARAADEDTELTGSGQVVGTPAFMSPEQARNLRLDPRSDLFSLGVMLYRLATGRMPFEGNTTMALLTSLAVDTPSAPRQVKATIPPGLEAVINKLLAKNPAERYQTAREVADALLALEQQKPAAGQPPVDAAPMAISVQFEVVEDEKDESGSRARLLTEPAEAVEAVVVPARKKAESKRPARKKPSRGPAKWLLPAVPVAVGAVAVALAALLFWPSKGTLVVESDDPDAELVIKRDGGAGRDRTRERELRLRAGAYTIELANPKPGQGVAPERFDLAAGAQARVRVTAEKGAPPPPPATDRQAAEYVLSLGGSVRVNDDPRDLTALAGLPKEPFQLRRADLSRAKVTDDGLAVFAGVPKLAELILDETPVTDAGLRHFANCKSLTRLDLGRTPVTDTGLKHFAGNAGLVTLSLHMTNTTDTGLVHFKGCKNLDYLRLTKTNVSGPGLVHFKDCKQLTQLKLDGSPVTDDGLLHLKGCSNLLSAEVRETKTTLPKLVEFSWSVPRCRVVCADGTVIEVDPDRRAAQYALSVNGQVTLRFGGTEQPFKKGAELPAVPFELITFNTSREARLTDAGLIAVTGCRHIRFLFLNESVVTDEGLAHFAGLTTLVRMDIYKTAITNTGLGVLKNCPDLAHLGIDDTRVTEEGLLPFLSCKNLGRLHIKGLKVSKEFIVKVQTALPQCAVQWDGPPVEPKK